jgi:hypothetical protein
MTGCAANRGVIVSPATQKMQGERMSREEALAIVREQAGITRSIELPDVVFASEVDDGGFTLEKLYSDSVLLMQDKLTRIPATYIFCEKVPFENVIYIRFRPRNGWIQLCETTHTGAPFFMVCPTWKTDPARKDRLLSALLVLCPNVR